MQYTLYIEDHGVIAAIHSKNIQIIVNICTVYMFDKPTRFLPFKMCDCTTIKLFSSK